MALIAKHLASLPWPIGSICRKNGRKTATVDAKRVFKRTTALTSKHETVSRHSAGREADLAGAVLVYFGLWHDARSRIDIKAGTSYAAAAGETGGCPAGISPIVHDYRGFVPGDEVDLVSVKELPPR